jgi:hypothetical protein
LRHVLDDDARLARNIFRQVFREQPGAEIVIVAGGEAGDEADFLTLVEIVRMRCCRRDQQADRNRKL